ncbi:rho GTPase-activating protein 28 isoform X4 [Lontra canadensis]|uniref:rho GTPase-activating protein 28 isoform X4 n=1 Tax=Lontra canadensis TaxID=76717 RepID=UPI0013F2F07C|nr:rho GTPase-activating protein 28 isoform X4 [Lontra canadensis]
MLVSAFVLGPERGHAPLRMEVEDSGGVVLTAYHSYARSQPPSSEPRCAPRATASHPGSRKSIPRCRRINRMLSNESLHSPAFSRSNSQASIDSTSMEEFLREIESIKENSMGGQEEQIPAEVKPVDEGELEAEWLQDVGLSTLISGNEEEDGKALLSTLTRTQAAAVKKRYNTYTQTMRKKNKQSVRDVRDIFGVSESPPGDTCDNHTAQLDGTPEEKELPGIMKTSGSLPGGASLNNTTLSDGSQDEEGSFAAPRSGSVSVLETLPALPVLSNGSPDPAEAVQNAGSDDDYRKKNIPPETEELSFEVSYSEMVTEAPKRSKFKKSDFKKEDYALTFFEKVEESGLESEGIFRLSGCTAKVKQYREELDAKFNADKFKWDRMCHREAAVMLKAFFRELPTSLFPVEYIPAFITLTERGPHVKVQFQALHLMIMALPDANRDTAQALMTFFNKVIANESKNRMSIWNISTIMAPNLFFSRSKHSDYEELQLANTAAHIIRLMLKYQKILWKVPSFLIMQVRRMNEATMLLKKQLPSVKKLLRRKTIEREVISPKTSKVLQKSPSSRRMSDVPEGVIRVHAPLLSKVSMAIQLTSHTKVKDILAKFQYENSHGSSECFKIQNQRLYEIGGNIGQHCLDPDAYILDIYHVNPQAEWVIKPQPSF